MRKYVIVMLVLALGIGTLSMYAGKRDELYLAALTEKDPKIKIQKLEEYYNTYGKKKKYQTSTMFIQLVETSLKLRDYEKTFKYSELGLASKKVEEADKMAIKIGIANAHFGKKELDKAEAVADEVITYGKSKLKENPASNKLFIAPAMRVKIAILESKSNTAEGAKEALDKSLEAWKMDKSAQSAHFAYYFIKKLYDEFGKYDIAEVALESLCQDANIKVEYIELLASWLTEKGANEKAIKYMSLLYTREKTSKRAYNLGKLYQDTNTDKSMAYFAEACVLGGNYATSGKSSLMRMYEDYKATEEQTEDEKNQAVQKIIDEAKVRLGK